MGIRRKNDVSAGPGPREGMDEELREFFFKWRDLSKNFRPLLRIKSQTDIIHKNDAVVEELIL